MLKNTGPFQAVLLSFAMMSYELFPKLNLLQLKVYNPRVQNPKGYLEKYGIYIIRYQPIVNIGLLNWNVWV